MSSPPATGAATRGRLRHRTSEERHNTLNQKLLDDVNASGEAFLSHTKLRGQLVLRLAIGNIHTTERDVKRVWHLLKRAAYG